MLAPSDLGNVSEGNGRRTRAGRSAPRLPSDHACARCPVRARAFCVVLEADQLGTLKAQGSTVKLEASQCLFHQGDAADLVYNLTSGLLKLYRLLPDGRRQITGFVFPGDFLGITLEDEHAFTAEAVEPAECCRYVRARFEAFVQDHPKVEHELYLTAAHELAAAKEQMVLLGRKTAAERLATFLLDLFDRARRRNADWEIIRVPMTRTDIADYLGLTKETISRTFTAFKNGKTIRLLPGDRIELLGRDRLEQLASGYAA